MRIRPLRAEHELAAILSLVEERRVTSDYTIRYQGKIYQIGAEISARDCGEVGCGWSNGWTGPWRSSFVQYGLSVAECRAQPKTSSPRKPASAPRLRPKVVHNWMKDFHLRKSPPLGNSAGRDTEAGRRSSLAANLRRPTGLLRLAAKERKAELSTLLKKQDISTFAGIRTFSTFALTAHNQQAELVGDVGWYSLLQGDGLRVPHCLWLDHASRASPTPTALDGRLRHAVFGFASSAAGGAALPRSFTQVDEELAPAYAPERKNFNFIDHGASGTGKQFSPYGHDRRTFCETVKVEWMCGAALPDHSGLRRPVLSLSPFLILTCTVVSTRNLNAVTFLLAFVIVQLFQAHSLVRFSQLNFGTAGPVTAGSPRPAAIKRQPPNPFQRPKASSHWRSSLLNGTCAQQVGPASPGLLQSALAAHCRI